MSTRLTACAVLLLLTLAACSPAPVFRLAPEPDTGPTTFYKGAEYSRLERDSIVVTIAYYRHWGGRFAMDLEVFNRGGRPVRVDPARFSREAYRHHNESAMSGLISSARAVDPELELLELDKRISRKHAARATDEALYFTLEGLYLAAAITSDSDAYEEIEEDHDRSRIQQELDRREYRYELMDLEQKREIWELETLRITDLYPEEYIRGLVIFPHEPKAAGYKIVLDIEGTTFELWYAQLKYKP